MNDLASVKNSIQLEVTVISRQKKLKYRFHIHFITKLMIFELKNSLK